MKISENRSSEISSTDMLSFESSPFVPLFSPTDLLNDDSLLKELEIDSLLLDYLVQHGAISDKVRSRILQIPKSQVKKRLSVLFEQLGLDSEESWNYNTRSLLVNALRSSGNHTLASILECGRKISPDPCCNLRDPFLNFKPAGIPASHSGWGLCDPSTIPRRRGQLTLWLQVSGMKVCQAALQKELQSSNMLHDQLLLHNSDGNQLKASECADGTAEEVNAISVKPLGTTGSGLAYWIDLALPLRHQAILNCTPSKKVAKPIEPELKELPVVCKSPTLFASLRDLFICCVRKKSSWKSKKELLAAQTSPSKAPISTYNLPSDVISLIKSEATDEKGDQERERLQREKEAQYTSKLLEILDSKSNELYQLLVDSTGSFHDAMVKFLEQNVGVLVLGCCLAKSSPDTAIALQVIVVATHRSSLHKMCDTILVESGKSVLAVSHNLAEVLRNSGVLDRLEIRDLRLAAGWSPHELQDALTELAR